MTIEDAHGPRRDPSNCGRGPAGPAARLASAIPVLLRPRLLAEGDSDADIRARRDRREVSGLRRGIYVPAGVTATNEQRHVATIKAAVPSLAAGSIVSHVSAAVLWGLPLWGVSLDRIHVSRRMSSGACRTAGLHVHAAADEITTIDVGDMAITNPARTVVDVARMVPFEQGVVTADAALRAGLVTPEELVGEVLRATGRTGAKRARAVIGFADGRSESVGESRSRVAMHRAGLAAPELQVAIQDAAGREIARSDFGYPDLRVVGEFDGAVKYGRLLRPGETAGDVVFQEKRREDAIRDAGWIVIRWVWAELSRPEIIVARWVQAFDRARRWALR